MLATWCQGGLKRRNLNRWIVEGRKFTNYAIGVETYRPTLESLKRLLRKEVIQPHVPVRLPCYDFVPVTNPTLGDYLSCESAHRLQVLSASMT